MDRIGDRIGYRIKVWYRYGVDYGTDCYRYGAGERGKSCVSEGTVYFNVKIL